MNLRKFMNVIFLIIGCSILGHYFHNQTLGLGIFLIAHALCNNEKD
jgi:hypothetical protein